MGSYPSMPPHVEVRRLIGRMGYDLGLDPQRLQAARHAVTPGNYSDVLDEFLLWARPAFAASPTSWLAIRDGAGLRGLLAPAAASWGLWNEHGIRFNPEDRLRRQERAYKAGGGYDAWVAWLQESRRAGAPLFTPEGVARATGGEVVRFSQLSDGIRARVKDATRPEGVRYHEFRIASGPGEFETEEVDGPWDGEVEVRFYDFEDDPTLFFTVLIGPEPAWPADAYADYRYEAASVTDDEGLVAAFAAQGGWHRA